MIASEENPGPCRRARAFTLMETLVVLGIVIILLSIFIPYAQSIWETSRRQTCEYNLYQIRDAIQKYAGDNDGFFPRVRYDVENNPRGYTAFTGADAGNPDYPDSAVEANDVTASLWLLVRTGYVTNLSVFVCPSSRGTPDTLTDAGGRPVPADQRGNFRKRENLTYSYASPFSNLPGYPLKVDRVLWDFAILADQNPGNAATEQPHDAPAATLAQANSPNHAKAGQNVLYGYNTVRFQRTPVRGRRVGEAARRQYLHRKRNRRDDAADELSRRRARGRGDPRGTNRQRRQLPGPCPDRSISRALADDASAADSRDSRRANHVADDKHGRGNHPACDPALAANPSGD